ncbi:sugar phosphate nucleotidyltransferase [Methanococcoides methylutens]|uniref:sugar phosphate nucleotidyltransferase n=1 Tax=Methanococcoides methylutens TaxID=2226 RepID=UPI004043A165
MPCTQINLCKIRVKDIAEKPAPDKAPSNIGAIGMYVFTPEIFDRIRKKSSGVGNEVQLTDGILNLNRSQKVYDYKFNGTRYDNGDKAEYLKAIIDFALNNENMKDSILECL